MSTEYAVEVRQVSKVYRDHSHEVIALENINFNLPLGEDLAIIGASGSGKTTLLQIVGGLAKPSKGEVLVAGRSLNKDSDNQMSKLRNSTIGFVFQMVYLQDYFTALENVMLPMLIAGKSKRQARDRAAELLTQVGLADRMHHRPNKLSGGEEQRVGIARALANDPKIILADEPTAKLDKSNAENIMQILESLHSKERSIVMITHDEKLVKHFPHVVKLEHGRQIK